MSLLTNFKELIDLVALVPTLAQLNADERQKIRDAVGTVAGELIRGLNLVQSRIEGAIVLARSTDAGASTLLQAYMAETTGKLFDAFSEFKICRGLRQTRDDFTRPFAAARASVHVQNIQRIDLLLYELEHDERMIVDEVGPLLAELSAASAKSPASLIQLAHEKLQQIENRKIDLRSLARRTHDGI
jgi:hypothetical protein